MYIYRFWNKCVGKLAVNKEIKNIKFYKKIENDYNANKSSPYNMLMMAYLSHFVRCEWTEAVILYKQVLEIQVENAAAHLGLGLLYALEGDKHNAYA
jgi:hypothetical protein